MSSSVKPTRNYGIQDKRWTVRDKITQYKGLINLYERDSQLLQYDRNIAQNIIKKQTQHLERDISKQKKQLGYLINDDQHGQQKSALVDDFPDLQLALQDKSFAKNIDRFKHRNFRKRKELDRLSYDEKKRNQILTDYKLELNKLQKVVHYTRTQFEQKSQLLSSKLKDAQIKQDAALAIQRTYRRITDVLRKDRLHFNTVLDQLQNDHTSQSKCLIRLTEIGQLATEYADDRERELSTLERAVKRDMKARINQMQIDEERVNEIQTTLKYLIRKDNKSTFQKLDAMRNSEDTIQMKKDIKCFKFLLGEIEKFTHSNTYEDIFSCFHKQKNMHERLLRMRQKFLRKKGKLLNKLYQANTMLSQLILENEHVDNHTQSQYESLQKQIVDVKAKYEKTNESLQLELNKLETLRANLLHLHCLSLVVKKDPEVKREIKSRNTSETDSNKLKAKVCGFTAKLEEEILDKDPIVRAHRKVITDTNEIFVDLGQRFTILFDTFTSLKSSKERTDKLELQRYYHKFAHGTARRVSYESTNVKNPLIEISPRDLSIPTYDEMKKKSQFIVKANLPPEWMR